MRRTVAPRRARSARPERPPAKRPTRGPQGRTTLPAVPDDIVFGIDIGGTGIKGAPVDVRSGTLQAERYRVLTPQPATPANVVATVKSVVEHFSWTGRVGCTFPAVVKDGVVLTAANVDKGWIGTDAEKLFTDALGTEVTVLNDADAAGLAE